MDTNIPNPSQVPEVGRPPAPTDRSRGAHAVSTLLGYAPTVVVFAALGAVGYWGHRTGWEAPKFSDLAGAKAAATKEDWCVEHGVPESRCIKCRPELVGANAKDWCPEHGLPESKCTICHPEILATGVAGDWCGEHGVPESSCTLCHPEIAIKGVAPESPTGAKVVLASADGGASAAITSPMGVAPTPVKDHDHGHGQTPVTKRTSGTSGHDDHGHDHGASAATSPAGEGGHAHRKDAKTCQTHNLRIQFASADAVRKAGVRLGQVVERPMASSLGANAELRFDQSRVAQISSAVAGKVWRVEKQVGQAVKQGEVIALIDSADVGRAKAELLQASADLDLKSKTLARLKTSAEAGFRTSAELQEADAAVRAAEIRLFNAQQALVNLGLPAARREEGTARMNQRDVQFMGLPKTLTDSLDAATTSANLVPLVAPFDGLVIECNVVAGTVVEPSKPLFVVADPARMWVMADVPPADAHRVTIGQSVTFRPDAALDQAVAGRVTWISASVDDRTRTVSVRAEVENPDGRLLANTFGKADIVIRPSGGATIAVPSEALQWEGCCHIAFVRLTDDIFQTRKVKLGTKVNGFTEVLVGLSPGEVVATQGSHVLKSEILKSALGAGCADGHH